MPKEHAHKRLRTTDRIADAKVCVLVGTDNTTFTMCKALVYLHRYPEWFATMQAEQDRLRSEHGETMNRHVRRCSSPSDFVAFVGDLVNFHHHLSMTCLLLLVLGAAARAASLLVEDAVRVGNLPVESRVTATW